METWVAGVKHLQGFERASPNVAYAKLTMSLQQKWQLVHNITPSVGPLFEPLEVGLREDFLPDLLGGRR